MEAGFPTLEARWFRTGAPPERVLRWFFTVHPQPERVRQRVDRYLRGPRGATTVGIKLRQGGLEIKVRDRYLGEQRLHPRVSGMLEQWSKWRFELAEAGPVAVPRSHADTRWIDVAKERLIQRYTVEPPDRVARVPPGVYPQHGCLLELAEIGVGGVRWWTLCFEAHGAASTLRETLSLVTRHVLARGEPPCLDAGGSFGYPEFLEHIAQGGG